MSDTSLFIGREEGVRRGSFCDKRTRVAPTSVTAESSRFFGGWTVVGYKRRRRKSSFESL